MPAGRFAVTANSLRRYPRQNPHLSPCGRTELQAKAQDKLITQSGDVKIVYNVDVGTNKVFYTLENKKDAPIQQIAKQDVLTIIHPDGSKEILNKDNVSNQKDEIQQENNSLPSFSKKEAVLFPMAIHVVSKGGEILSIARWEKKI